MPITTYGTEYLPWNSFWTTPTGLAGTGATWDEVTPSATYGFYPLHVIQMDVTPRIVEVGYGPVGAERPVAVGMGGFPFATPGDLIPQGSRVVARSGSGTFVQVSGIRADKWAPDPAVSRQKTACPQASAVTVTGASDTLVAAMPYPFVLTNVFVIGLAGAGADNTLTISVGPSGNETPVWSTTIYRADNTPQCYFDLRPRLLPIPAGTRLSAVASNHSYSVLTAGYRLDF